MFFKLIFYLCVLKSAFGFGLRYPGDPWRQNDYEYNQPLKGWLKLHEEPTDWLTARVNCHMEGSLLASPWSIDFTEAIHDLIRSNLFMGQIRSDMMWSGVHSSFDEGALKSVDGKQVVSLRHEDLAPLERCGVFRLSDTDEVQCTDTLPYICYRPGPTAPLSMPGGPTSSPELNSYMPEFLASQKTHHPRNEISKSLKKSSPSSTELPLPEPIPSLEAVLVTDPSKCGDESLEYQFAEITGHCYKFHAHAIHTWDLAKSACEEEGAYLAIANSDEEVKVLKTIYPKRIYGAPFPDTAAIGFYKDWGTWKTLDGESIEDAGYAKWRPEAPHFSARLGFIARDGLLYGYTRDVRDVPYICEKPAMKQELNQATESTELNTVSTKLDEVILPVMTPLTETEHESIESTSVTTDLYDEIDLRQNTGTESIPVDEDEATESKWNTEALPAAEQADETTETKPNTESESVIEEQSDTQSAEDFGFDIGRRRKIPSIFDHLEQWEYSYYNDMGYD